MKKFKLIVFIFLTILPVVLLFSCTKIENNPNLTEVKKNDVVSYLVDKKSSGDLETPINSNVDLSDYKNNSLFKILNTYYCYEVQFTNNNSNLAIYLKNKYISITEDQLSNRFEESDDVIDGKYIYAYSYKQINKNKNDFKFYEFNDIANLPKTYNNYTLVGVLENKEYTVKTRINDNTVINKTYTSLFMTKYYKYNNGTLEYYKVSSIASAIKYSSNENMLINCECENLVYYPINIYNYGWLGVPPTYLGVLDEKCLKTSIFSTEELKGIVYETKDNEYYIKRENLIVK